MEPLAKPEPAAEQTSVSTGPPAGAPGEPSEGKANPGQHSDEAEASGTTESAESEATNDTDSSDSDPQQPDSGRKESS
jgi:hypothetical protein